MTPHTLFISDLHLQETEPHSVALFEQFLKLYAPHSDALYILGDFFEIWPGDDENSTFSHKIRDLLKKCIAGGTPVYILPGNRDFLLGPRFAKDTGCTILRDPTVIHLYDQSIVLLHGDTLCTHDRLHQTYRRIVQNRIFNRIATHILPLFVRHQIGQMLRRFSRKRTARLNPSIMDAIPESVTQLFRESRANLMVHGHTHRQKTESTQVDNRACQRFVLGSWHEAGSALRLFEDGAQTFLTITD